MTKEQSAPKHHPLPAPVKDLKDRLTTRHTTAHQRWSLALAVGNGGGVVAAAGALLQKIGDPPTIALLLPTCWLFSVGLIAAGAAIGVEALRSSIMSHEVHQAADRYQKTGQPPTLAGWFNVVEDGGLWVRHLLELGSAGFFASALLVPLAALTFI